MFHKCFFKLRDVLHCKQQEGDGQKDIEINEA